MVSILDASDWVGFSLSVGRDTIDIHIDQTYQHERIVII